MRRMGTTTYLMLVVATLACIANLTNGYVLIHERPGFPNRGRPSPLVEELPSPFLSRLPIRGSMTHEELPTARQSRGATMFMPNSLIGVRRRLADVEEGTTDLGQKYDRLNTRTSSLEGQMYSLQSKMRFMSSPNTVSALRSANTDLETRVSRLESENEELREFMASFEQFFSRLMSADPATFDAEAAPEERLSRLHQYLGNAEAELISETQRDVVSQTADEVPPPLFGEEDTPTSNRTDNIPTSADGPVDAFQVAFASVPHVSTSKDMNVTRRGYPTGVFRSMAGGARDPATGTSPDSEGTLHLSAVEADRLAAALGQLTTQNTQLTARLQSLEQQAADSNHMGMMGVQSVGISSRTSNSAITYELLDKVDRLEQVVALQASAVLDGTAFAADRVDDSGAQRGYGVSYHAYDTASRDRQSGQVGVFSATASRTSATSLNMNPDDVEIMKDVLQVTRDKGSSSRKCAFSVARTTALRGTREARLITFDHVYVNKGRDFNTGNSTFVCERAGFYFITFNLRSFDDHYLGVTLMKNSEIVTAVYTDADTRNVMEGQSVIVHLEPGDALYLRLGPSERFALHSDIRKYVTFSGFMIYSGY